MSAPQKTSITRNDIRTEYSAIAPKSKKPSRATKAVISVFKNKVISNICEIGCGLLANTPHILKAFPHVVVTDSKAQYDRIEERLEDLRKKYNSFKGFIVENSFKEMNLNLDGAILINVVHILPTREERIELLKAVYQNLRKGGTVFIDAPRKERYYRDLVKTAIPFNDGYLMSRNGYYTFYKDISFEELKDYIEEAGFKLEQRIYLNHRITFTAEKV